MHRLGPRGRPWTPFLDFSPHSKEQHTAVRHAARKTRRARSLRKRTRTMRTIQKGYRQGHTAQAQEEAKKTEDKENQLNMKNEDCKHEDVEATIDKQQGAHEEASTALPEARRKRKRAKMKMIPSHTPPTAECEPSLTPATAHKTRRAGRIRITPLHHGAHGTPRRTVGLAPELLTPIRVPTPTKLTLMRTPQLLDMLTPVRRLAKLGDVVPTGGSGQLLQKKRKKTPAEELQPIPTTHKTKKRRRKMFPDPGSVEVELCGCTKEIKTTHQEPRPEGVHDRSFMALVAEGMHTARPLNFLLPALAPLGQ